MNDRAKTIVLLLIGCVIALALDAQSPLVHALGAGWPGWSLSSSVGIASRVFFFGLGFAILVDGFGLVRAAGLTHPRLAAATHLAVVWLLMAPLLHSGIGQSVMFDVSLLAASFVAARFFYVTVEDSLDAESNGNGPAAAAPG